MSRIVGVRHLGVAVLPGPDRIARRDHAVRSHRRYRTRGPGTAAAVTAKYEAPDLIGKRPQVSSDIYAALGDKLAKYGAQVINIDMRNFSFSPTYMAAINDQVTQEQLRLAAENKLKTVEAEQKQKGRNRRSRGQRRACNR